MNFTAGLKEWDRGLPRPSWKGRRRTIRFLVLTLGFLSPGSLAVADIPPSFQAVLTPYRDALGRAEIHFRNLHASGLRSRVVHRSDLAPRNEEDQLTIARNGKKVLVRLTPVDWEKNSGAGLPTETVDIVTPSQHYSIHRQVRNGSYFGGIGPVSPQAANFMSHSVGALLDAPYCLQNVSILRLLDSHEFSITGVVPDPSAPTGKRLKISFRGKLADRDSKSATGWWTVDPENGWGLIEYECRSSSPEKIVWAGRVRYGQPVEDYPLPKQVEYEENSDLPRGIHFRFGEKFNINDYQNSIYPENQFTLDYYGLGDLAAPVGAGSRPMVVILSLIAVFATLGWWFLRRR